eukprot:16138-Heterococcus_DN1.PRE.1
MVVLSAVSMSMSATAATTAVALASIEYASDLRKCRIAAASKSDKVYRLRSHGFEHCKVMPAVKAWWGQCSSQPRPFDMYSPQAHALFSIVVPQLYSLLHTTADCNASQHANEEDAQQQQQQQQQQRPDQLNADSSPTALPTAADAQLQRSCVNGSINSSSGQSCCDAGTCDQLPTADTRCSMLMPDGRKCKLTSVIYREPGRRSYSNTVHRCVHMKHTTCLH